LKFQAIVEKTAKISGEIFCRTLYLGLDRRVSGRRLVLILHIYGFVFLLLYVVVYCGVRSFSPTSYDR